MQVCIFMYNSCSRHFFAQIKKKSAGTREMRAATLAGLHAKCAVFLFDFNQYLNASVQFIVTSLPDIS